MKHQLKGELMEDIEKRISEQVAEQADVIKALKDIYRKNIDELAGVAISGTPFLSLELYRRKDVHTDLVYVLKKGNFVAGGGSVEIVAKHREIYDGSNPGSVHCSTIAREPLEFLLERLPVNVLEQVYANLRNYVCPTKSAPGAKKEVFFGKY